MFLFVISSISSTLGLLLFLRWDEYNILSSTGFIILIIYFFNWSLINLEFIFRCRPTLISLLIYHPTTLLHAVSLPYHFVTFSSYITVSYVIKSVFVPLVSSSFRSNFALVPHHFSYCSLMTYLYAIHYHCSFFRIFFAILPVLFKIIFKCMLWNSVRNSFVLFWDYLESLNQKIWVFRLSVEKWCFSIIQVFYYTFQENIEIFCLPSLYLSI